MEHLGMIPVQNMGPRPSERSMTAVMAECIFSTVMASCNKKITPWRNVKPCTPWKLNMDNGT